MSTKGIIEPLSQTHPDLCLEWSEKNGALTPDMFTYGCHDSVWWKCINGHEWKARIGNRVSWNSACPYCSGKRIISGVNDFASLFPEIAKEWSERNLPLTPGMFFPNSNKRVFWKCRNGHEWSTAIENRSHGYGCPICSGKKFVQGINDLKTKRPELTEIWSEKNNPLSPDSVCFNYSKRLWWHCPDCGSDYSAKIWNIDNGYTCPYCRTVVLKKGFNDLKTTDPDIAATLDTDKNYDWSPEMLTQRSKKYLWWKCPYSHSYGRRVRDRILDDSCPVCKAEYRAAFPFVVLLYMLAKKNINTEIGYSINGFSFVLYIPEYKIGINFTGFSEYKRIQQEMEKLDCAAMGIRFMTISKMTSEMQSVVDVRQMLKHIGVDVGEDADCEINAIAEAYYTAYNAIQKMKIEVIKDE